VQVPPGCEENFTGDWAHAEDSSFRYAAIDDGGSLELEVARLFVVDAGRPLPAFLRRSRLDGGSTAPQAPPLAPAELRRSSDTHVHLERTPQGFVGETVAQVLHPAGRTCTARYPTQVLSCTDAGLTLRTGGSIPLGEACQSPPRAVAAPPLEHLLVRADAGS
jgi:hypothetical protein